MSSPSITYQSDVPDSFTKRAISVLNAQAKAAKDLSPLQPFCFIAKDQEEVLGGLSGCLMYGAAYIDLLYVEPSYQGKGIAQALMAEAQGFFKEKGMLFMHLVTFDFEARGFYEKLGFTVEFQRTGYENDSILYSLIKPLR